ncbi:hypothetical protein OPQ81_000807 [Rhizoctonia solani]|nr:hypothetical protein OPQ81_000807 [Rhizoctonia solani]
MASEVQKPIPLQRLSQHRDPLTGMCTIASSKTGGDARQGEMTASPDDEGISLPPVDKGIAAWSFVAAGFMLETLVWGFGFTYGVFQEYFLHNRTFGNASEAGIGAVGTVALAIEYFEVLFVNIIAQQWPHRTRLMMWSSLALCCGSLFLASFATQVSHLILLQGILFGIGGGGLYAPVIIYLSEWFSARRGLAAAIIFRGSGAVGACFPIAVSFLLSNLGFRWSLRIWAAFMLVFGALALAFTRPRLPVVRTQTSEGPSLWTRLTRQRWSFLKNPLFICMTVTTFIQAVAYFPVSLYMTVYTASLGLPALNGSLVLSVFNFFEYYRPNYFWSCLLGVIFAFVIIFGSLSGGFASVWPAVSVDIAGSEESVFLNVYGLLTMTKGVAAIIGPLIASALYRPEEAAVRNTYSGYGFRDVTLFVGSMMVATALGGVAAKWAKRVV